MKPAFIKKLRQLFIFCLCYFWCSTIWAADKASLIAAIHSQNHTQVIAQINELRRAGVNTGVELLFFEGQALMASGKLTDAERALSIYVTSVGREAPRYAEAVWTIAQVRVALAHEGKAQTTYSASGVEGDRVVGKVETVNTDYGYIRIRLNDTNLDAHDLYVKPDEFGSVRYRLRTPKKTADGLLSVIPEGDIKQLKTGQPVYRLLAEDK